MLPLIPTEHAVRILANRSAFASLQFAFSGPALFGGKKPHTRYEEGFVSLKLFPSVSLFSLPSLIFSGT